MKHSFWGRIFFILIYSTLLTGCGKKTTEKPPKTVRTTTVSRSESQSKKEFPFIAKPIRNSQLSFRVSGLLTNFNTNSGAFYRKGSTIASIDPRDFSIRREKTQASFKQSEAEYKRIKALFETNNISASAHDKAQADFIAAKTAYETARNELHDTFLKAPFDGYVSEINCENFQEVKTSQPILSLVDISSLKIEVYVTQQTAFEISRGDIVNIRFDLLPQEHFEATVDEVSKDASANNLAYKLTVLLSNPNNKLMAGMSGSLIIPENKVGEQPLALSIGALCHSPGGDYVWSIDENRILAKKPIRTGRFLPDGKIEIREGLKEGDRIVTTGMNFLSEGMEVNLCE